jgi:DNA-directed RNA polymerase beta subunit
MNTHDALTLTAGINLGVLITSAVVLVGNMTDDRRAQRTAEAQLQRSLKRHATQDWRDALTLRERV